jgi:hypothetical protein
MSRRLFVIFVWISFWYMMGSWVYIFVVSFLLILLP